MFVPFFNGYPFDLAAIEFLHKGSPDRRRIEDDCYGTYNAGVEICEHSKDVCSRSWNIIETIDFYNVCIGCSAHYNLCLKRLVHQGCTSQNILKMYFTGQKTKITVVENT